MLSVSLTRNVTLFQLEALLDSIPPDPAAPRAGGIKELAEYAGTLGTLMRHGKNLGPQLGPFIEMLTAPAARVLERWFESEPLRSTLATDAVIGAMMSPETDRWPFTGGLLLRTPVSPRPHLTTVCCAVEATQPPGLSWIRSPRASCYSDASS